MATSDADRGRGLRVGLIFLGVCFVWIVLEVLSITTLGSNANSTFSNVVAPATQKAATRPPAVPPVDTAK